MGVCIAVLCAAWPGRVKAAELCALPEVLRALATELQRHGVYGTLDARSVVEVIGQGAARAACSVTVTLRGADTLKFGDRPTIWFEARRYHVTHLRNGLMVGLDD